jgi:nucleoid-associated protein YgaU
MRPKIVAVALTGGILVLGAGGVAAATLPSWPSHTAGTVMATTSPAASPATATPSSSPSALPSSAPSPVKTPAAKTGSKSARAAMPHATGTITYTVKHGDTLSAIAAWFSLHGYGALYAANESVIGSNPNLIFPGEHITISHGVLKTSGTRK